MNWIAFVGEGRCGHTIISAILDSHPNLRISEEVKYLGKWNRDPKDWPKERIIKELHASGYGRARKLLALPGMLTYTPPLLGIGDKCGWDAINEVRKRGASTQIFTEFSKHMDMPVKVIHVSRHPLDNISAWVQGNKQKRLNPDLYARTRLMIRRYSRFYTTLEQVIQGQDVFHIRHEALCEDPSAVLIALCNWLGIPVEPVWKKTACKAIFPTPNRRFEKEPWPFPELIDMVYWRIIDKYPSLDYYRGIEE